MATLKLKIEDGKLVGTVGEGRYFEGISEDGLVAEGNGWTVTLCPGKGGKAGKIVCHAEREYSTGLAICHREFRLQDGILGLAGGDIRDRYAYFRKADFQAFLDGLGIDAVKREDPNRDFLIGGDGRFSIKTDGQVCQEWEDHWSDHKVVSGATWAVVRKEYNNGFNRVHSTLLYTMEKDVTKLNIG